VNSILEFLIFFGGFLSLVLATAHLVEKNKSAANYLIFLFLASIGVWQIYHGCMISGILFSYPHLALVHVPFLYISAPLLYFYYTILTRDNYEFKSSIVYHFIPVVIIIIFITPFYMKTAGEKLALLQSLVGLRSSASVFPAYPYLIMAIVTTISVYAMVFVVSSIRMFRKKLIMEKNITFFSIIIIAFDFTMILIYIFGYLSVRVFSLPATFYLVTIKTISVLLTIQIYLMLVLKWRYPDYIMQMRNEAERIRYATSRIERLDVDTVLANLKHLMEAEKVFCDEELSLGGLADELDITPYQLSQIINERLHKNFNTYINEYRIRESESYLIDDPKRSVLSVSCAVGFNTLATFYNAFCKIHGMTPTKFRERYK
jgi:AraC-like DNA-binding protein